MDPALLTDEPDLISAGALKIKEMSYLHAEGYSGGALKHGPFALIEGKEGREGQTPVIVISLDVDHAAHMRTAAEEVRQLLLLLLLLQRCTCLSFSVHCVGYCLFGFLLCRELTFSGPGGMHDADLPVLHGDEVLGVAAEGRGLRGDKRAPLAQA
jgi:hypothetical protein